MVIGRKLRQEQFLEKLTWKRLLIAKIICEMGTTNNWLGSVAFVERDWERRKTAKRLGREETFSSAFRAFLPPPSPPLPFFYASQATTDTEDHLLRGAGFADWEKTITQLSPISFDTTFAFLFISLKSPELFFQPVKQRAKARGSFSTVSLKWHSRQNCVTICSTVIA